MVKNVKWMSYYPYQDVYKEFFRVFSFLFTSVFKNQYFSDTQQSI